MQLLKRARSFASNRGIRALAIFLAVMAVLTMISRAVDSLMIPQVSVSGFEERKLEYPQEIAGRVGTVGKRALYCQENLRIENVWVQQNDTVEKGDLLFTLDREQLDEKIRQLELESHKYDLQIADIENAYQQQIKQQNDIFQGGVSGNQDGVIVTADQGSMDETQSGSTGAVKDNAAALLQLDKREVKVSLDSLYALREHEGNVCAEFAGRVYECAIFTGSLTSSEPVMILEDFNKNLRFEGVVGRTDLNIEEGVKCTLEMEEEGTILEEVAISKVVQGEEGTYRVIAEVEEGALRQTGNAVLSFTKESKNYRNCIPLSALYSGKTGYYVIAVEEDMTILGIQSVAKFVPVSVIESNDEYAAVEGDIYESEKIVVQANKEVKEGERVRIVEE